MKIDLDKTLGFETAKQTGIEALHKTLTRTPAAQLGEVIASDLTTMLNQGINTLLKEPGRPLASMLMAQVVGYLGELAKVTGALAKATHQKPRGQVAAGINH